MPDTIERTIYKLEIDDSGYLRGVESLSASTKKFTEQQEAANKVLQANETNLKNQTAYLQQTKKDLDSYTGTNEKYRAQLQKSFQTAQADNLKLTEVVNKNRQAYDLATQSAQNFADVSAKASNLQQQTTGGKIPTPGAIPPNVSAGITSQIAGVLNIADFTKQAQIIEQTKNEFDDLRISIGLAEARMKQLNATDEEFKLLAPIVAQGKEALNQYDNATKGAEGATVSLRTQLRLSREELVKLEQAGLGATKQYFELEKRTAKLTDEFNDQQQRIRILSSDTKLLDFGKGAITAATSAFQAYTAISILAGDESAELQKKTMQLFAAMQLLQSLEQLSNLTRREGVLATLAQSGAQSVYTAVVGASTGALKTFRLALAATGIGAAIVLIGFLVNKYLDYRDAIKKAGEQQKVLSDIVAEGNKEAGKQISDLKILYQAATDVNLSMKERLKAVKALQTEFPDYFANIKAENLLNGDAKEAYDKLTTSIIASARATAAKGKLSENQSKLLDLDIQKQENADQLDRDRLSAQLHYKKFFTAEFDKETQKNAKREQDESDREARARQQEKDADIDFKKDQINRENNQIIKLAGLDKLVDVTAKPVKDQKPKTDKAIKEIQNDFDKKKAELDARLAALNAKEADDESKIRIEFAARLAKEQLEIQKNKNLTKPQKTILKAELVDINKIELDKALTDFRKKQTDARQKLNDELLALQDKNIQDQLNLIQDEFERRAKLIDFNEQKELDLSKENTQKRLAALDLEKLLIGEQAYQDARAKITTAGEQEVIDIQLKFAREGQILAADKFKKALDFYKDFIFQSDLIRDEAEAADVSRFSDLFLSGKISYEEYQRAILAIQKNYAKRKRDATLLNDQNELRDLDNAIKATIDKTTKEYAELLRLRDELRKKISGEKIENKKKDAEDIKVPDAPKEGENSWDKYVASIVAVGDSVIAFWQAANDAEAKALDRSISLQEKRVAAAQRIADRGNAQYLKAEEDRLTELNIKRENAARKQLGIDAALQASQILVGITGAIAHIAKGTFGAETIAEIAIIIGALATGYGLVKSLQGNQPKLFKGTPHLERGTHPVGRDTIPAWLNEGEAVIPTQKNKKYKKSVEAIYHGKVPAEVLNDFVENYVRNKTENKINITKDKKTSESNDIISTVHKVLNEVSDKKISSKQFNSIINNKINEDKKTSNIIQTISKLVNEKVEKKHITSDLQNSLVNKNVTIDDIHKYSEVINKVVENKINTATYKNFVQNISKVPAKVLNNFINNYEERKFFRGTPELRGEKGIDKIPIWASVGEAIIPAEKNNLFKPVINSIFEGKIPAHALNSFVKNYHQIKSVPQVDYDKIKGAAEMHIGSDGKLAGLLNEQNRKIDESNDLHRQTIRALKSMGVNVNLDKNGLALSVMEVVEQIKINSRI